MAELFEGGAVPFGIPAATGAVAGSSDGSYCGFTVRETSGTTAATVAIYDSETGTNLGAPLEEISLAAGASLSKNYPRPGRRVSNGLWAVVSGTVTGSVFQ
jgi:hypothetical protein